MKRIFLIPVLCLLFFTQGYATHNRAGQITYQVLNCATRNIRITITTYTKLCNVCPDRDFLDSVYFGDNPAATSVPRHDFQDLNDSIRKNHYIVDHSYSANGDYVISFTDPNRNEGIDNIPNSVNVPFCVQTTVKFHSAFGCNSSPELHRDPLDKGCVGEIFTHNPWAIDPEGDSMSYVLTVPRSSPGVFVSGYTLPAGVTMNAVTGDLVWNTPQQAGEYNFAFYIIQWRFGHAVDSIERDMQVFIDDCPNKRPHTVLINDTCILAGQNISFTVTATDPNNNPIWLTSDGAPYHSDIVDPPIATFSTNPPNVATNPAIGTFNWNTQCSHIRPQPYTVFFAAKDTFVAPGQNQLVDLTHVDIRVIPPPPTGLTATASGNSIILNWNPGACATDSGYNIYRRTGPYNGVFNCPCETGVPVSSGYTRIASVSGNTNTTYIDAVNNLIIGVEYCYVVTAIFDNGAESCPSNEACARLKKDLPVITHASVIRTDTTGSVFVQWEWPDELDQTIYPPPHEYRVYHSPGFFGANFTQIGTLNSIYDTTFVDTSINTIDSAWSYKIELYYDSAGVPLFLGKTETASTVYLSIAPTDERLNLSWEEHVPWTNQFYDIFRAALPTPPCYDTAGLSWDSIGRASTQSFSDSDTILMNGVLYRYYVKSVGTYSAPGYDTLRNNSQEKCAVPYDNVAPCPPSATVTPDCIERSNLLVWNNLNNSCADDVTEYRLYFRSVFSTDFQLIQTFHNAADTSFIHSGLESIAGCYYITALDTPNFNESSPSPLVCVDTCFVYNVPNVFTPDGDGFNDLLHPCDFSTAAEMQVKCPPYQNVKDVGIKIFNRWGEVVFETNDRDIKWNGKNQKTGKNCPDGVYYYTGEVNFIRINGITTKEIHGFVHLLRKK